MNRRGFLMGGAGLLALPLAARSRTKPALAQGQSKRVIIDMAGREVAVNWPARRVVTLGSVPVINSFIFALGEAESIINGLPAFASTPRYKYHHVFAPHMAGLPQMQDTSNAPLLETILLGSPDVVVTLDTARLAVLESNRIPAVLIHWRNPDDVKEVMRVLAQLYDKEQEAADYAAYFDETIESMAARTAAVETPPKVLYTNARNLSQPHLIAEWWIRSAGGASVTDDGRETEVLTFTLEQILAWDPDVILLSAPADRDALLEHPTLSQTRAVRDGRFHVVPIGAHIWGNRTIEQPLTVRWAASKFHPDLFPDDELADEVHAFYARFFKTDLSQEAIAEILSGTL